MSPELCHLERPRTTAGAEFIEKRIVWWETAEMWLLHWKKSTNTEKKRDKYPGSPSSNFPVRMHWTNQKSVGKGTQQMWFAGGQEIEQRANRQWLAVVHLFSVLYSIP